MAESHNRIDNVLDWVHRGYPRGVPQKDYFPLLALLTRTLTEEEVVKAANTLLRQGDFENPVTEDEIKAAIREVAVMDPNPEEVYQVASRLASVGWPLAVPAD